MKTFSGILIYLLIFPMLSMGQSSTEDTNNIEESETRQDRKEKRKLARQQMTDHFRIGLFGTYAFINSSAEFTGPNSIVSVNIDLEKHFGLRNEKMIYYGILVYRITPRSGVNMTYYRLHRQQDHYMKNDIIFLRDTIPKGHLLGGFMTTSMISFGYLFSILLEESAYLGAFINLYIASNKVGIESETFKLSRSVHFFAATPNFGLVANIKLKKWLMISGGFGVFFLNTEDWSANFLDLQIMADFYPMKWLGIGVGYQAFLVNGSVPGDFITTHLNYSIKGPNIGLKFVF